MSCIKYHDSYKYQLIDEYTISLPEVYPEQSKLWTTPKILTDYALLKKGKLTIYHGYAWDGPSGPAIDTRNFMRGSLVHDVLYEMIRDRILNELTYRIHVDELLRRICLEDGMSRFRAWWVYYGVRFGGYQAVSSEKPIFTAP